ncbi:MAG: AI-2E family transporter [Porticoccus sp.]|mgnify:CR=1 FL=1|nr:AI-2E family transporter [Porticoccus sp.]
MLKVLNTWINRYLGEEESVLLAVLLIFSLIILITLGQIIAPFIAALVFAFLLQGGVNRLMVLGVPRMVAVSSIFLVFISILTAILIVLLPLIGRQAINLVEKVPSMLDHSQGLLFLLSEKFPKIFSENQTSQLLTEASRELGGIAQNLVSFSFDTFPSLLALVLYVILVPLLVFFMLKDKEKLLNFLSGLFPHKRPMMRKIWKEMNSQMANYVRGKAIEIVIVGSVSYAIFLFFGLNYAALLALLVGLSVIIPYIGALLVSIPVVIVAYFQWGWEGDFFFLLGSYAIIQALDGNVLVPLLFSEAVNLHPVSIILAVILFGGIWGFWGVFFAIPLATLVKALYSAWPNPGSSIET